MQQSKNQKKFDLKKDYNDIYKKPNYVDFLLIPHSQYHLTALTSVAKLLSKKGFSVCFLDISSVYKSNLDYDYINGDFGVFSYDEFMQGDITPRSVCCMNDWESDFAGKIINACKQNLIPTIAICEGVNDFHDVDTRYIFNDRLQLRNAYGRCDHVVLNGSHDLKYFKNSRQRIYSGALLRSQQPIIKILDNNHTCNNVLINYNFSYGQLSEFKAKWLAECVNSCNKLNLDFSISVHPDCTHDKELHPYLDKISDKSLNEDIKNYRILISRFSGVIIEGLIHNANIIYYNPGIEKIDKFNDPKGSYLKALSPNELIENLSLITSNKWHPIPEEFLKYHAGYGLDAHSTIADILIKIYLNRFVNEVPSIQFRKSLISPTCPYDDEQIYISGNKYFDYTLNGKIVFVVSINKNLDFFANKIVMQNKHIFKVVYSDSLCYKEIIDPDSFNLLCSNESVCQFIHLTNYNFSGLKASQSGLLIKSQPLKFFGNLIYINDVSNENILKTTFLALKPFLSFTHYNLTVIVAPHVDHKYKKKIIDLCLSESICNVVLLNPAGENWSYQLKNSHTHLSLFQSLDIDIDEIDHLIYLDALAFPLTVPFSKLLDTISNNDPAKSDTKVFKIAYVFDTPNNGLCWSGDSLAQHVTIYSRGSLLNLINHNLFESVDNICDAVFHDTILFINLVGFDDIKHLIHTKILYKLSYNPFHPVNCMNNLDCSNIVNIAEA